MAADLMLIVGETAHRASEEGGQTSLSPGVRALHRGSQKCREGLSPPPPPSGRQRVRDILGLC